MRCHCDDCRRANERFGIHGSRAEGVTIWQTTPDKVKIDKGAQLMRLMRMTPGGVLRWYAGCCDTPLFNTTATPKLPFVGVLTDRLETTAPLGPIIAEGFVEGPDGRSRHVHGGRVVRRFLRRAAAARLSGRWRDTPFFDPATGAPAAAIERAPDRT